MELILNEQYKIPEGYILVPIEPNGSMIENGMKGLLQCTGSELYDYSSKLYEGYFNDVERVYAAMLKEIAPPK